MSDIACATLYLKGSDIGSTETSLGKAITSTRSTIEWYNINLRILLGDLYEKYDTFNISLTSICCAHPANGISAGGYLNNDVDNANVIVYLSGLPFINNTYSVERRTNTQSVPVGFFAYPTSATAVGFRVYNSTGNATFGKSQDLANIRITLKRVLDDADPETTGTNFPITNYTFTIFGVEKKSINGSRI